MQKKWTKETVFEESKKYSSRSEFKKKKSGAFRIAYMNGWLDEMIWLVRPTAKPIKWTKEAVFEESRKYFIVTEFMNNAVAAYTIAKNNNWLTEMDWLAPSKRKPSGYWKIKENVINESKIISRLQNFKERIVELLIRQNSTDGLMKWTGWQKQTENLLAIGKRKITYLRNLRNTTIEVIFVKDVILLILQLKIMDGLMK